MKETIHKLVAVNVPFTKCNLKCQYCYLTQRNEWDGSMPEFKHSPEEVRKALSKKRLGGISIINLTGRGETLIPPVIPKIIRELLEEGHYLEVVTNGTLTKRFDEIAEFPRELLEHLEFKFSFHYMELKRLGLLDTFFDNISKMRDAGCSFTLELMPYDELIPYIDDIKALCIEKVGAICQVTVGRNDLNGRSLLTKMKREDYVNTWSTFNSTMFKFKMDVYDIKRNEFCYAGMWSLYVDLITGDASQCYGFLPTQNIYNISKPLYLRPVGHGCKQPFCYNAHAFLCLGDIPELSTPSYVDIRNRITIQGKEWLSVKIKEAFSCKLKDSNEEFSFTDKLLFYITTPIYWFNILKTNKFLVPKVVKKIKKLKNS